MATCQQQAAINSFRATRWRWKSKDKNISANTWKRRDKDLTFQMFASRRSRSVFVQEILVIFLPAVCFEKEIKWIVRLSLKWPLRSVLSRIHGVTPSSRKKLRRGSRVMIASWCGWSRSLFWYLWWMCFLSGCWHQVHKMHKMGGLLTSNSNVSRLVIV